MANLVIRGIPDALQRALRVKTAQEGITLKDLVVPLLEMAVNSKPVEMVHASEVGGWPEGIENLGPVEPIGVHVSIPQNSPEGKLLRKSLLMPEPSHGINCRCFQCRKK